MLFSFPPIVKIALISFFVMVARAVVIACFVLINTEKNIVSIISNIQLKNIKNGSRKFSDNNHTVRCFLIFKKRDKNIPWNICTVFITNPALVTTSPIPKIHITHLNDIIWRTVKIPFVFLMQKIAKIISYMARVRALYINASPLVSMWIHVHFVRCVGIIHKMCITRSMSFRAKIVLAV